MASQRNNLDQWVGERLSSLEAARDWRPDSVQALVRLREQDRVYLVRRRRWTWVAAAASLACLFVLAIPGRCDSPSSNSCGQPLATRLWSAVFVHHEEARPAPGMPVAEPVTPAAPVLPPAIAQVQKPAAPSRVQRRESAAGRLTNYKELGSPDAPITCEIYTDYECPACAALYRQIIPMLVQQYVQTGKVRLVHRDFPLPQHPFARLAARYANAAGQLGQYEPAVEHLFQTQDLWARDGSIDTQLSDVLAPGIMQEVRSIIQMDPRLDDSVAKDL